MRGKSKGEPMTHFSRVSQHVMTPPLSISLPVAARVARSIFHVSRRRVAQVATGEYPAGHHTVAWGATAGGALPGRGICFFARLLADGHQCPQRVGLPR